MAVTMLMPARLLFLPDTDDRDAVIARRCCKMIESLGAQVLNSGQGSDGECGHDTLWPNKDNSMDGLINRADEALYQAKKQGRN